MSDRGSSGRWIPPSDRSRAPIESSQGGRSTADSIEFLADNVRLVGTLFRPDVYGDGGPGPAIVVVGAWTSIVEGTAERYASKLAAAGLMALSFEFSGFGRSGGEPRELESLSLKARDIHAAISFLVDHPAVDETRIGVLAICQGAGSAVSNAIEDMRVRSLALIAPWLHDAELVLEIYGARGGSGAERARYVPAADAADPRAAVMAWTEWLRFDAIALAPRLRAPTLVVRGEEVAIGARRFYDRLTCPKQLVWVPGTQRDFYERSPTIDRAVSHAVAYLAHHLEPPH